MRPLDGIVVLDLAQFLAGPSAALRLGDLGADVIKLERPGTGELGRRLALGDLRTGDDSLLFRTINRGKRGVTVDLKDGRDAAFFTRLVARADVLIENFRPGIMERLGFGWDTVSALNDRLIYGKVTGYGPDGPWRSKPGQDLLAQAVSGLPFLNGSDRDGAVPFGLSVADLYAGSHLAQGILACLVRRSVTGRGGLVEVSLLEAAVDLEFELLTTFLNDGHRPPSRGNVNAANAYLAAPYGVYATSDGWLAIAMCPLATLAELLDIPELAGRADASAFADRDEIKALVARRVRGESTAHWLSILEPADVWCADVLTWERMIEHPGFRAAQLLQEVGAGDRTFTTTRCPIRVDGEILRSSRDAPLLGEDDEAVRADVADADV